MNEHQTTMIRAMRRTVIVAALALATSSCSALGGGEGTDGEGTDGDQSSTGTTSSATSSATGTAYESEFSTEGSYQSHTDIESMDFVFTLYPSKATPRTNEWYPLGSKFFSFTLQAYDTTRNLRDPFESKRKVYLSRIVVTTATVRSDGGQPEAPYSLDALAQTVTFDPEPETLDPYGMLITSPKGSLEMRNQEIVATDVASTGIDMSFTATVFVETSAGSEDFVQQTLTLQVPIALYDSEEPTVATSIPANAN